MSYIEEYNAIVTEEIQEEFAINGRKIEGTYEHIVVSGDDSSNTVYFSMNETFDGVALDEKDFKILYKTPDGYTDIADPVEFLVSGGKIRFGWLLTGTVTRIPGVVEFAIRITSNGYIWNTLPATLTVEEGFSMSGSEIPELERDWVENCLETSKSALTLATNNANSIAFLSAKIQSIFATFAIENKIAGITVGMTVSGLFPLKFDSWSVHLDDKVLASALGPEDEFVTAPVMLQNEGIIVKFQTGTVEIVTELEIINKSGNTAWGILKFIEFT